MASPISLQRDFSLGMKRDFPRDRMPSNAVWEMIDFIPDLRAPVAKRGGWEYASAAFGGVSTEVRALAYPEFSAGAQLVAIDEDGLVSQITSPYTSVSGRTTRGTAQIPVQQPFFFEDLMIITSPTGGATVKKYTGAANATALGGSPPQALYGGVYKSFAVLAGGPSSNKSRVWFSDANAPESWDTATRWVDTSHPIKGLAMLRNAILVFSERRLERIRGSIPPGSGNSDMDLESLWDVGIADARSIAIFEDNCVFVNGAGIYITDGAAVSDLTKEGGMKTWWLDQLEGYSSTWTFAGGLHRGHYFICVMDGTTFKFCLVCDIARRVFWRITNVKAIAFARSTGEQEQLYFGGRSEARLGKLSSIFDPSTDVKLDGSGLAVTPVLETRYYDFDKSSKNSFRGVYVSYSAEDAIENPLQTVSYIKHPHETSYTALSPALAETTELTRARRPLRFNSRGIAFKVSQAGASAETHIHEFEVDAHPREGSRL